MTTTARVALERIVAADIGGEPYVVGGALRDALLERSASELDIVVADAARWAERAAAVLGVRAAQIGRGPFVWRLAIDGGWLDVTDLAGDLEADLRRRDFTVNAMAAPPAAVLEGNIAERLIDPLGGRDDLADRRLRLASPQALDADPVRILRGMRLEATHGLRMDAATENAARRAAPALGSVAGERVWAELDRILSHDHCSGTVRRMESLGALDAIIPELAQCRGVDQRPVHRRDVLGHQLDAVEWLDVLIASEPPGELPGEPLAATLRRELWDADAFEDADALRGQLWDGRTVLRLATLLHDIGKPGTRRVEADGRTRFFGHSELGAELAQERLRALRAPAAIAAPVQTLILHHLRPGQVAAAGQTPSDRALYRFHKALGELAVPLCWLFLADSLATVGGEALAPRWPAYAAHVSRILGWRDRQRQRTESEFGRGDGRILDGHAIMQATGLPPGPRVGAILAALDEAAAVGEITTAAGARALAVQLVGSAGRSGAGGREERGP